MIPIVFSTDHNYVMPTGVTISSLLLSSSAEEVYDIFVLISPDVTESDREALTKEVDIASSGRSRISFLEMGENFSTGFEIRGISTACYFRLLIPWLIPQYDKIFYSDVDIIFQRGLKELYAYDLGDAYVAGAYPSSEKGFYKIGRYLNKLGLNPATYINSGFLLINSKEQRANNLDKQYKELSSKKFTFQDQDIINIVCQGHIVHFDCRYNLMVEKYGTRQDLGEKVNLHYAGDKPWNKFTYCWVEWWNAFNRSTFRDLEFYHKISARILSPKSQLDDLRRKAIRKARIKLNL